MYQGVLGLHSYWAYAVVVFLFLGIINAFSGLSAKRVFTSKDRQISMFGLIFSHVQFVIGLVLLFTSPLFDAAKAAGMGEVMKNAELRKMVIEHPVINLLAIVFITIGWSKHKRTEESAKKFKSIGIFYVIGLVLLLSRIPWNQWFD